MIIRTASRDLDDMVRKVGTTGRSVHYVLASKLDINWTNRTWNVKPVTKRPKGPS